MRAVVVDGGNLRTWGKRVQKFAKNLDDIARCQLPPLNPGLTQDVVPTTDTLEEVAGREDNLFVVVAHKTDVWGYLLATANGYVLWASAAPDHPEAWQELATVTVAKYGRLWGRVTNPVVRETILASINGIRSRPSDPAVVEIGFD